MHPSWTIVALVAGLHAAATTVDMLRGASTEPLQTAAISIEAEPDTAAVGQEDTDGGEVVLVEVPGTEQRASEEPDWSAMGWPDDHRSTFLSQAAPLALEVGRETCALPSVTLAQAILETGWGRSSLARRHHNWFGIKGKGRVLPTLEYTGIPTTASFRTWDSPEEGVRAYAELLRRDRRYAAAWTVWPDGRAFVHAIAGRWATNPDYARQLVSLIDRYDLDRWDAMVSESDACVPPVAPSA